MPADLSRFKVIYNEVVWKAISLVSVGFEENVSYDAQYKKPKFIEIIAINENGNIVFINDEAWRFQFIHIVNS